MEEAIRLLVCDIDGTLVRHDKSLSDANVAAIRDLCARGVAVSLISARPPSGMLAIAEKLELVGPFGAFNGGTLFDHEGTIAEEHRVDAETAARLLALYGGAGITRWLFSGGHWFASDLSNSHIPREVLSAGIEPVETADFTPALADVDKLVAVCDDAALLGRIEEQARTIAGQAANVVRSQVYYLDATAPAANKGQGVRQLAERFGVALEEVAVIGDQANDVAMFQVAGLAVAMGQASAEVQAAAQFVTASNEQDGVARAIESIIVPRTGR